ncbi:Hypothetical predicted protein [Podarcis lilfordi]|uniref:Uncharacterized protein n=1 Tax=Podarcis lilfordi TaxID=74358 RepID=A0AA35L3I5_9SAUR|nr:Hypothetical predicted protein [Podarcis lilfordi]
MPKIVHPPEQSASPRFRTLPAVTTAETKGSGKEAARHKTPAGEEEQRRQQQRASAKLEVEAVQLLPSPLARDRFTQYSAKNLRQAWNKLSYVNHAEDLASKLLQCFPKNRLSAQAALSHEYFSDLPPRLWELTDMSSIFSVPNEHVDFPQIIQELRSPDWRRTKT